MTDPHAPLRNDVRLLGKLLGDTVREKHGQEIFDLIEEVRSLSKAAHVGDESAFGKLRALFDGLSAESAVTIARAFSHFLTLANIAEQHHRVRRRRQYRLDPEASPQRASFEETFSRLRESGLSGDRLHAAIRDQQVELVLTAHPTEVARRTLLQKHNRIACLLAQRDRPDLTADERRASEAQLRREVIACWTTDEIRRERPTPLDEARGGLVAIENTLWDVVPAHLRELSDALERHMEAPTKCGLTKGRSCSTDWRQSCRGGGSRRRTVPVAAVEKRRLAPSACRRPRLARSCAWRVLEDQIRPTVEVDTNLKRLRPRMAA